MIGRRPLLLALPAFAPFPAIPSWGAVPPGNRLAFRVMRNDAPIGTHVLEFTPQAERVEVRIAIDLAVRFLGLVAYRYRHRNTEVWERDRLLAIDSETDRNGRPYWVRARAVAGAIEVEGSQSGAYRAPRDATSTSYWHARFLRSPVIDTQGGRLLSTRIEPVEEEIVPVGAAMRPARRFRVSGDLTLDIWYDAEGVWSGLLFTGEDGSTIRYVRS
ncbi:MAG: DUF6134 family protein [Acetobacteraceae bacterium]|nr:DUF6134 family protein [Acetobacteraceae bacterium]